VTRDLQAYLDVEMFRGDGISKGLGLGGYVNGDVIRAGPANLGQDPYLARLYLRYLIPLSEERMDPAAPAMGQLPGAEPASKIEIKVGKMAPTDNMDLNRYANNQRTQFLNYAFIYNTAWDYASDTRGYSYGFFVALVRPSWRLAWGSYMTPTTANGYDLDPEVYRARGDNLELSLRLNDWGTAVSFLTFFNQGRMGDYREALDTALATSTTPNITANEKPGRIKYGFCINLEQPLTDNGETGFFARAGISDGNTSAWSYTDVDRHLSVGFQVSGIHWNRGEDRFGIAYSIQGLSGPHEEYLAAGGMGMVVGDGKLNYGLERILETYYRIQLGRYVQVSPDFQYIENPGFNQDRGPVKVYGLRVRLFY
jgi:carbohydrate-selective porin OprB